MDSNYLKCVLDDLKSAVTSIRNEIKTISDRLDTLTDANDKLNDKINGQTDKFVSWMNFIDNKTTLRLVRIDETVRKSANSINVIVRLVAGAQNLKSNELAQILIEAEALTNKVKSTTDIHFEDIPTECLNVDFLASHIKDLLIKTAVLPSKNLNTGNPSFDPINTNVPSTTVTNSTIPQTSSIQINMNQNQSSSSTSSNISNVSNNTYISSTSAVNSTPETSSIQNTMNQNHISSNVSNVSYDTNIHSINVTSTSIPQTSSVKNTTYQNQSSSTSSSIILNVSNNTSIPSTSSTNSIPETSSIPNTMNQSHISSTISSNVFDLSANYKNNNNRHENSCSSITVPNVLPYVDDINQERRRQEQEALRKKYRNKYRYLDKYKNLNEKNTTQDEEKNIKKPHFIDSEFTNVSKRNSSRVSVNALNNCQPYRDPIFDGIQDVELVFIEEGNNEPRRVIKPLSDIQPRVLLNLIDANSADIASIHQRLAMNGESKSQQSNLSETSDEMINSIRSNHKNVATMKRIKSNKKKSEMAINVRHKRKAAMTNNQYAPPKKRAYVRKQSNIK